MRKGSILLLMSIMVLTLLAACSGGSEGPGTTQEPPKTTGETSTPSATPAPSLEGKTIKIGWPYTEEVFKARFDGIAQKLKVELVMIPASGKSEVYQELFAQNIVPDIIVDNYGYLWPYQDLDIIEPLDELAKKHNFSFNFINPGLVSYIKGQDPEGRMMAIPDGANYMGLFYNKKVFDYFNIPYPSPTKPMTWDQVFDLAQKMTKEIDGVQYVGLQFGYNVYTNRQMHIPLFQFGVNATDPKTGELRLTKEPAFTRYLELMKKYFEIPGNFKKETQSINLIANNRAGMMVHYPQLLMEADKWGDLKPARDNLDIAPLPVWSDMPTTGHSLWTGPIMINKYSKEKDAAFRVLIEYLSKENQARIIRPATTGTALNDMELMAQFGADHEGYKGRNVKGLFVSAPAVYKENKVSRWDQYVSWAEILKALNESPDRDIATVLRQAEDTARGKIKDAMDKVKK
jgi:multiple sugar transport system substrate-binding protein